MNVKTPTTLLLAAFLLATASLAACTEDPCDTLDATCEQCADASYKAHCKSVVSAKVEGVCSAQLPSYQTVCPNTSTSSAGGTGGTTPTGSGSTSGAGGSSSASSTASAGGSANAGGAGGAGGTASAGGA
ncbi:MAG: hypothetical protein VB934_17065 [Polyangiaceae bacterium]